MEKVLFLMSGGMDSTTLGYWLNKEMGFELAPVYVMYGSNHMDNEMAAVKNIIAEMKTQSIPIDDPVYLPLNLREIYGSAVPEMKIPLLQNPGLIPNAEDQAQRTTVVPYRNLAMLVILAGIAELKGIKNLAHGAIKEDYDNYRDCRDQFFDAAENALSLSGTQEEAVVNIIHPFTVKTKTEIVKWGVANNVPYPLTYTCYKGQALACGNCDACKERLDAFRAAGAKDPLVYFKF